MRLADRTSLAALLQRPPVRNRLILAALWAGMWSLAVALGIRFETFDLSMWHFIDPVLLRDRPIESLLYLHSQPPLFNAVLAAVLPVLGDGYGRFFYVAFALMALSMVLMAESVVRETARSSAAALVAGVLLVLSPAVLVYAHTLFHALPTAFLAVLGIWTARRAARQRSLGRFVAFGLTVAAAALLWAVFHPVWVVAAAAWFVWAMKGARARACAAMAIPVLLVGAVVVKNGLLFEVWGTSSWSGMNLARIVTFQLPNAEREAAVRAGILSPVSKTRPFAPLRYYRHIPDPQPTGIPLLDRPTRSNSERNLHHLKYVEISRHYMRDARIVLHNRPGVYINAVAKGFWLLYLHPADDFHVVEAHRAALGAYADVYAALVYGQPPGSKRPDVSAGRGRSPLRSLFTSGILLKVGFLVLLVAGPLWVLRLARAGRMHDPDGVTAAAMIGSILYVTLVCSVFEIGENQRFRFTVEPLAIMATAMAGAAVVRRFRRRAAPDAGPDSPA